jgi:hypothetical protein
MYHLKSALDNKLFKTIEWLAPSFVFVAIVCHAFDLYPIGPMIHIVGASLWVYVGVKKKAGPVLLNFIPQIPIWALGLIYWFVGR